MKVQEIVQSFQKMSVCDRIYLICQMLQKCTPYELLYIRTVLTGTLQDHIESLSAQESSVNSIVSLIRVGGAEIIENIDKLVCTLALLHVDNKTLAEQIYKILDNREILGIAETLDDKETLDKLRLLYVLAVYHPAFSFSQHHHLLSVHLRHLDELYHAIEVEEHCKKEEMTQFDTERPAMPSTDAVIVKCELKGVYKRQSDRRYPYIVEVEWSDGAFCVIHRTYGDFFSFQNKLLDSFPEESGQRNKKNRVIPFLPGRKLLSGRSNRELAEKRLFDLWTYTRDLFCLSDNITTCKHVLEFFKPRPSDLKENIVSQKITTLADIRNKDSNKKSMFSSSPSSSPSRPHSAIANLMNSTANSGRASNTLPMQQSPSQKDKDTSNINRRSTYPARPSAFVPVTLTSSNEKLHSSSQNSISSNSNDVMTPPTTTACLVVTPPNNQSNGSPAFSVSRVSSSDSSPTTLIKMIRPSKMSPTKINKAPNVNSSHSNLTTVTTDSTSTIQSSLSWADRSAPPTNIDPNYVPFQTSTVAAATSTVTMTTTTTLVSPPVTTTAVTQIYSHPGHTHSSYPCSYTPTNFDSPNPSPKPIDRATPTNQLSEFDHFKKWLKCQRLHKYGHLFQNLTFKEISELSIDKMKELGMTQGAANKLQQKMEELIKSNITSFHEIPLPSITRRPSTTSLPAALLLERQQLTPSSSIDQLSLHGSTCSLDILAHAYNQHTTPTHFHRHSDSVTDMLLSNMDTAIIETGPTNRRSAIELGRTISTDSTRLLHKAANDMQPRYSTPSPTRAIATASITPIDHLPSDDVKGRGGIHDDKSTNRFTPSPHHFVTPPSFHRKEHEVGGVYPKISHGLLPATVNTRIQGGTSWSHPIPQLMRNQLRVGYGINGLVRVPAGGRGVYRVTCYNCGSKGHHGAQCTINRSSYHHFTTSTDKHSTVPQTSS